MDTVTTSPSTVAVASADTVPAGTEVCRVVNACATLLPGATAAIDFVPNVDDTASATGIDSWFEACTVSRDLPATHLDAVTTDTSKAGSVSFNTAIRASWRLKARSGASIWF